MFSSIGHFRSISCPAIDSCPLPNCLFSHEKKRKNIQRAPLPQRAQSAKRIKVDEASRSIVETAPNEKSPTHDSLLTKNASSSTRIQPQVDRARKPEVLRLAPAFLPIAPASHPTRQSFLDLIHKEYVRLLHPSPVQEAVSQEEKLAKSAKKQTYGMQVKQFLKALREQSTLETQKAPMRSFGPWELDHVRRLVAPRDRLERYGYILETPDYFDGVDSGWERCDRCFKDFDRADQRHCDYHFGRLVKAGSTRIYSCCKGPQDSPPCTSAARHVYRVSKNERLHKLIPFVELRAKTEVDVVAMDCEMIYTSLGTEVARATLVDGTGRVLLDQLCLPKGEVWDFATRYSGISSLEDVHPTFDQLREMILQVIGYNTVLLVHGGENDMAALRLLHDRIVDTAIIYTHPRGPPFRYALRDLAKSHLSREIQSGGGKEGVGHSSLEDSIATLDLVLKKIRIPGDLEKTRSV